MGDTVEAIGYKADVPARTKERVSDTFSNVKEWSSAAVRAASGSR